MSHCPTCKQGITLAAIENNRNGKWTVLALDRVDDSTPGDFFLDIETHEAVNLMGEPAGEYPIAYYQPGLYRTHPPSHFLGGH